MVFPCTPHSQCRGRLTGSDLLSHIANDSQPGPDGQPLTADDLYPLSIAHVKVHLIGLENQAVFTDADGRGGGGE